MAEAGELPNISIRVVPFGAGLHAGMLAGGFFVMLDFANRHEPTTVYTEGLTGALYLDKPAEAERYAWAFGDLCEAALDEVASRDLLLARAKEYEA